MTNPQVTYSEKLRAFKIRNETGMFTLNIFIQRGMESSSQSCQARKGNKTQTNEERKE